MGTKSRYSHRDLRTLSRGSSNPIILPGLEFKKKREKIYVAKNFNSFLENNHAEDILLPAIF